MDILRTIYFTITTPSLNADRSKIVILSEDGMAANWCQFGGFEQVDETTWRLIIYITHQYLHRMTESNVRYAYITGILYSEDGEFCKHINIEDNFRIKQEGCVSESVILVSGDKVRFSEGCEYLFFEDTSAIVVSPCTNEEFTLISSVSVDFTQPCEFATLLLSNPTASTFIECDFVAPMSSESVAFTDICDKLKLVSAYNVKFAQDCALVTLQSASDAGFIQLCGFASLVSTDEVGFTSYCQMISLISSKRNIFTQICQYITPVPDETTEITQQCE